ncbi:MAG: hypothetical protein BGO03_16385 [Mesorhizobium sp. 61-13]|nr:MAG: hypothetical protein BGO03_16385 [Mesorhizobium sp. 61-13]
MDGDGFCERQGFRGGEMEIATRFDVSFQGIGHGCGHVIECGELHLSIRMNERRHKWKRRQGPK